MPQPSDENFIQFGSGNRPAKNRGAFGTNPASPPEVPWKIAREVDAANHGSRPFGPIVERVARLQAEHLARAAERGGQLIRPEQILRLGQAAGRGQEHLVFISDDASRVIKITRSDRPGYGLIPCVRNGNAIDLRAGTPAEYFERLYLQNHLFGDDLLYECILRRADHRLAIVISQTAIEVDDPKPNAAEISRYMEEMGFTSVAGHEGNAFYRASDNVAVFDAHEGNLIKTPAGLVPIDVVAVHPDDHLLRILERGLLE